MSRGACWGPDSASDAVLENGYETRRQAARAARLDHARISRDVHREPRAARPTPPSCRTEHCSDRSAANLPAPSRHRLGRLEKPVRMLHPHAHQRATRESERSQIVRQRMIAEHELRRADVNPDARRARDEARAMQRAVYMAVRHHGGVGQIASATADDRECQHMPPVHDEPTLPPPLAVAEVDALDGLRKAPDAAAGLAREALV